MVVLVPVLVRRLSNVVNQREDAQRSFAGVTFSEPPCQVARRRDSCGATDSSGLARPTANHDKWLFGLSVQRRLHSAGSLLGQYSR
jgi:hypothetical protein